MYSEVHIGDENMFMIHIQRGVIRDQPTYTVTRSKGLSGESSGDTGHHIVRDVYASVSPYKDCHGNQP
jgi:hypothetical protein